MDPVAGSMTSIPTGPPKTRFPKYQALTFGLSCTWANCEEGRAWGKVVVSLE